MGLFDWLPGYRTPNIFDAIEFIDSVTSDPETEGKKTDMSVRLRSMNLSTLSLIHI